MNKEQKLIELKSQRVKSITKFTNDLHDMVATLYEHLMDEDVLNARKTKVDIRNHIDDLKIDF